MLTSWLYDHEVKGFWYDCVPYLPDETSEGVVDISFLSSVIVMVFASID